MVKAEAERLAAGQAVIEVRPFDTLLVKFAAEVGASVIIRGLRAVSDFEYEFQMVAMNQRLNTEIETVFLMADPRHQAISSRLVKEIALLGGDIRPFTTPAVADALFNRSKEKS
jgi:pantetheine-phosphate adenylyltransferase